MVTSYDLFFGVGAGGLAPAFAVFKNDDNDVALAAPALVDKGSGFYRFQIDWSTVGATSIRYAVTLDGYPDMADTLQSPASGGAAAAALTPSAATQNLALFPTAKTVLQRAAVQCGLAPLDDPYGSSDQAWTLLRELFVTLGDDLMERDWTHFVRPVSFVTDGVSTSYLLPPDYHEIVDQTLWNRSTRLPGLGPLSPQQAAFLQARLAQVVLNVTFQMAGGRLVFPVVPPAGFTVSFSYTSSYWVQSSGAGSPDKDRPGANDDVVLFDEELLVLGLKLKWLEDKGFDTAIVQGRFDKKLEHCLGKNDPAPVLSLGIGNPIGVDRMIDGRNIPEGGW